MLLDTTEVNVEFVEMLQERAKRSAFGHFGEEIGRASCRERVFKRV